MRIKFPTHKTLGDTLKPYPNPSIHPAKFPVLGCFIYTQIPSSPFSLGQCLYSFAPDHLKDSESLFLPCPDGLWDDHLALCLQDHGSDMQVNRVLSGKLS
jgi:hypothetical protein